jgi:hypothetical protein
MMMLSPDLIPIVNAINAGDKARARALIQSLLKTSPSAEVWYQASRVAEKPEHELICLQRALGYDPYHIEARRRLSQLQPTPPPAQVAPQVAAPDKRRSTAEHKAAAQPAKAHPIIPTDVPLKKARRRKRGTAFYITIVAMILLSLSSTYFVMLALGSPLPGRLRSLLGAEGPVTEIDGVPLEQIPDAVFKIPPARSSEVTQAEPLADILEPGVVHEYTFAARAGEEIAIGIQFFSPTAQRVNRNIAVLDPEGKNAEAQCNHDQIIQGDNGAVITCHIDRSGLWQVRLLGRVGESSGAYVVSVGRLTGDHSGF